jgi:hypothetical protein
MTQDLVQANDPDWADFQSGDPDYYLRVAGTTLRKYCGWHLFPSKSETITKREIGSHGIIDLPTRYITAVASVVVENRTDPENPITVDPTQYVWFPEGNIQLTTSAPGGWSWGWPGAYFYGPDAPYYLPVYNFGLCDVTLTHGYDILPDDVKQIAFELAKSSMKLAPSGIGNVKEVGSPQYKTVFGTTPGMTLTPDQKCKLANYRVGGFK